MQSDFSEQVLVGEACWEESPIHGETCCWETVALTEFLTTWLLMKSLRKTTRSESGETNQWDQTSFVFFGRHAPLGDYTSPPGVVGVCALGSSTLCVGDFGQQRCAGVQGSSVAPLLRWDYTSPSGVVGVCAQWVPAHCVSGTSANNTVALAWVSKVLPRYFWCLCPGLEHTVRWGLRPTPQ